MAFRTEPMKKKSNYYSIKDGNFRLTTDKEDPEAVRREYTNPKTGETGVAYEREFKSLFGVIREVTFHENTLKDGTVLRSIHIGLGEDENGVAQIISLAIDSRFTSDFLKRLPAIDLKREVRLAPYDFEPKEGPRQVGISITHSNDNEHFTEKVQNFFLKEEIKKDKKGNEKKTYKTLHGFPEPTDEDKQDWPFYFKKVSKFLIKYAQENVCQQLNETRFGADVSKPQDENGDPEAIDKALDEAFSDKKE